MVFVSVDPYAQVPGNRVFTPEQLREDLELLRTTVHEAHADPYRFLGRAELDHLFDRVSDGMSYALPVDAFIDSLEVLFRAIGDGHTRCDFPRDAVADMALRTPLLPVEIVIIDSALYVRGDRMGSSAITPGSRIVSIDGVPDSRILTALLDRVHGDGRSGLQRSRLVERDFAALHAKEFGAHAEHVIVCDNGHDVLERVVVHALTGEELSAATAEQVALPPWRSNLDEGRSLAWVELNTLDARALSSADQRPERFLGDLLREMEKKKIRTVVFDLRGADGADLGMAEQVFAIVAQKPFRVVRMMTVRSVTVPTWYRRAVPLDDFYASAGGLFALEETGLFVLPPTDERMKDLPASQRRFDGAVYVLQDGLTREAGAAVGTLVKRSGRGKLIGEQGGTNAVSYCGGRELTITAPNTGVRFTVPLIRYTFEGAATGPQDLGELPDVEFKRTLEGLVTGEDAIRRDVLSFIEGLR
ncbi:MAG: S41 family peptidase [Flavobacteriales bacterium]